MAQSKHSLIFASIAAAMLASPALAESPYTKPNNTWISIDGTVEAVSPDSFTLDYGQGVITVEMDDGDRDADAYKLVSGDRVSVMGKVDDDFYEVATIEASSVYVENLGTHFYASSVDEEDAIIDIDPVAVSGINYQGEVTSVDKAAEEFTLDSGPVKVTVEVDEMIYNPLDDEGYQKVSKGDVVSVTGNIDTELFEGRVFDARTVTTIYDKDKDKASQPTS